MEKYLKKIHLPYNKKYFFADKKTNNNQYVTSFRY